MEFIWEAKGHDKLAANLKNSRQTILTHLDRALRKVAKIMVPALKEHTPIGATHHLRNKTVGQVLGTAEDMRLEIRQGARGERGYFYGQAVRGGTRPHFPPPMALVPWVEAVLGIHGKRAKGVAYAIAYKISRIGTQPNPYHVRALQAHMSDIQAIVDDEGVNVLGTLADIK